VDSIEGRQRTITLILPDDQEARAFGAERVQPTLKKAGFTVNIEDRVFIGQRDVLLLPH
jgi:hypothetical protein